MSFLNESIGWNLHAKVIRMPNTEYFAISYIFDDDGNDSILLLLFFF